jgi:hypothetical protein
MVYFEDDVVAEKKAAMKKNTVLLQISIKYW